jgi:hypothetical protein
MIQTANLANAPLAPLVPTTTARTKPAIDKLDNDLQAAREHARRLTEMYGISNRAVAVAWDTVEELLTAKARRRAKALSPFEQYCTDNPGAPEARMYDL